MALPLLALGATAGLVGSMFGAQGQSQRAQELQRALEQGLISLDEYQQQAQQFMMEQAGQAQELLAPGQQAYATGLEQYQQFLDSTAQDEYARGYMSSDIGRRMAEQAEQTTARTASATGALRTSDTVNALAAIRPQIMQNAVGQRFAGLQNLVGMGAPAIQQGANIYSNLGSQVGNQLYGIGQARLGAAGTMGEAAGSERSAYTDAIAGGISDLGGLAMYQELT